MKRIVTVVLLTMSMVMGDLRAETNQSDDDIGAGIRTEFGDVVIENLGIGQTYNLRELCGKPLKVTNTGKGTIELAIDAQIPVNDDQTKIRRELGYRPIPSIDWLSVSQGQFVVPGGESAFTDVLIKIPNDPSLYGKKFQGSIYSRSIGKGFLHLGVWSNILITIIHSPEAQAEMERNRKRGVIGNMDYSILPDKLVIQNAPLGRKLDITKEIKKTIKLANSGTTPIELRVKVIPIGESSLSLQEGFENPRDLSWLTFKSPTYTVDPDTFVDPGFVLNLPDKPELHHKKLMFVIRVEPADADIVGITYYGKIYVEVQ